MWPPKRPAQGWPKFGVRCGFFWGEPARLTVRSNRCGPFCLSRWPQTFPASFSPPSSVSLPLLSSALSFLLSPRGLQGAPSIGHEGPRGVFALRPCCVLSTRLLPKPGAATEVSGANPEDCVAAPTQGHETHALPGSSYHTWVGCQRPAGGSLSGRTPATVPAGLVQGR